jgi:hypothetical protein
MQLEAELQRFGATTDRLEAALSPEPSVSSVSWTVVEDTDTVRSGGLVT